MTDESNLSRAKHNKKFDGVVSLGFGGPSVQDTVEFSFKSQFFLLLKKKKKTSVVASSC